jgi:amino acid adenylation domain-containing protein
VCVCRQVAGAGLHMVDMSRIPAGTLVTNRGYGGIDEYRPDPQSGSQAQLQINVVLAEPVSAGSLEKCLGQSVAAVHFLQSRIEDASGRLFEFIGPGAGVAPAVCDRSGPLITATMREGASSAILSVDAHPAACNELGLAAIVRSALQQCDGIAAGLQSLSFPREDARLERSVDRLPMLPVLVPLTACRGEEMPEGISIPLADGTIEALGSLAMRYGVDTGIILQNVWALYVGILNGNEPFDLLYSPFDSASWFFPHRLMVQSVTCEAGDSLESLLAAPPPQSATRAGHMVPGRVTVMSLQPGCLDLRALPSVRDVCARSLPNGSDFHLTLVRTASDERLSGTFAIHRIDANVVRHRLEEFAAVIRSILDDPARPGSAIDCLPADERRLIQEQCTGARVPLPSFTSSAEMIAARANERPDAAALRFDDRVMNYGQLAGQVGACCRWLASEGIEAGQSVAVMLPQSPDFVIVTLALLSSGCTWVALDRNLPPERLAYICDDSQTIAIVTDRSFTGHDASLPRQLVYASGPAAEPAVHIATDAPAYLLYTSGSTGKPKGVMISRGALLSHHAAIARDFKLKENDRVLQFTNPIFDVAVEEIFPTLASGASLVFLPDRERLSIAEFHRFVVEQELTVLNLPAGLWHEWVRYLETDKLPLPASLRLVIAGSDRVSPEIFAKWRGLAGSRVGFRNGYGPTEATITATLFDPDRQRVGSDTVPIGRPVANMMVRVVRDGRVMPYGVRGELLLSGPQLAGGYVGREDLTREVFVDRTIDGEVRRWYHTGDEAWLLPDGNLEFLGRLDHQVKLNGFRIELGEVERVLETMPDVSSIAAVVKRNAGGIASLVAYYTTGSGEELPMSALASAMTRSLPAYMQPVRYQWLEEMPLTPGGKVNRRALPDLEAKRPNLVNPLVRPGNSVEAGIADIWRAELGIADIGVLDNFFELGGSSISGLRIIEAINRRFSISLSAARFFQYPTVASLARHINEPRTSSQPADAGPTRGTRQRDAYLRLKARRPQETK